MRSTSVSKMETSKSELGSSSVRPTRKSGGFILSAPNGAEEWVVGSTRQITWTTTGSSIANVKLEYSKDNFATATVITASTSNAGFYNWLVPNDISATVKVRVSDPNDPGTSDASDATF